MNTTTLTTEFVRVLYLMFKKPGISTKGIGDHFDDNKMYCNYTKMKYWGLIFKEKPGIWHPTALAIDFLKGAITLPDVVYYHKDQVIRTEGAVRVWDLLNKQERDNFREAMKIEMSWRTEEVQSELF